MFKQKYREINNEQPPFVHRQKNQGKPDRSQEYRTHRENAFKEGNGQRGKKHRYAFKFFIYLFSGNNNNENGKNSTRRFYK